MNGRARTDLDREHDDRRQALQRVVPAVHPAVTNWAVGESVNRSPRAVAGGGGAQQQATGLSGPRAGLTPPAAQHARHSTHGTAAHSQGSRQAPCSGQGQVPRAAGSGFEGRGPHAHRHVERLEADEGFRVLGFHLLP
jgi:hypothetical protein